VFESLKTSAPKGGWPPRIAPKPRRRLPLRGRFGQPKPPLRKPGLLGTLGWLDQTVLRAMRTKGHWDGAEEAMKGLGAIGEWGLVWIAIGLGTAVNDQPRRKRWIAAAAVAPVAVVANFGVKMAVGRDRPLIDDHPALARAPSKLSFPSAHATSSFAAATALGRVEPAARPPLYALAGAICLSRPYLGMHYPSDVLAGIAFGYALGRLAPGLSEPTVEERMIDLVANRPPASDDPPPVAPPVEPPETPGPPSETPGPPSEDQ
jgi:membrane-associated phospholipid phosphatase